jgi:uncharacterized membrane protein
MLKSIQYIIYTLGGFIGTIPTIFAKEGLVEKSVAFVFALALTILVFDFFKQYQETRHRRKMWTYNYDEI